MPVVPSSVTATRASTRWSALARALVAGKSPRAAFPLLFPLINRGNGRTKNERARSPKRADNKRITGGLSGERTGEDQAAVLPVPRSERRSLAGIFGRITGYENFAQKMERGHPARLHNPGTTMRAGCPRSKTKPRRLCDGVLPNSNFVQKRDAVWTISSPRSWSGPSGWTLSWKFWMFG